MAEETKRVPAQDHVRDEAPRQHPADQGTSVSSYGDGTATIDKATIEAREAAIKREAEAEKTTLRDAEALKKASSGSDPKVVEKK